LIFFWGVETTNQLNQLCSCTQQVVILFFSKHPFLGPATRNVIATSSAITACEKANQWQGAIGLLEIMFQKEVPADTISFSSVISACEKRGFWELALSLLNDMRSTSLTPDAGSFNAGISACAAGGQWRIACDLLGAMPEVEATPDMISFSAAIVACDKCEKWTLALCLLKDSLAASILPDTVLFNSVLHSLETTGNWRLSLAILREMPGRKVPVNELSYRATMGACRQWPLAMALWQEMCGVTSPSAISASSCILICARQGAWQAAVLLLQQMLEKIGFPEAWLCRDF